MTDNQSAPNETPPNETPNETVQNASGASDSATPVDQAQINYDSAWQNARYRRAETLTDLAGILSLIERKLIERHCRPPVRYGTSVMEWCHTWMDEDGQRHTTRPVIMVLHNYLLQFEVGNNFKMSGVVVESADTDKVFDLFVSCLDTLYAMQSFRRDAPGEWREERVLVKYHIASDAVLRTSVVTPPTE